MPNQDSPYACCTLPNGDEWHLPFRETREHGLLIELPVEKLEEAGFKGRSLILREHHPVPAKTAKQCCTFLQWSDAGYRVGPFHFKSITFPNK